jgi:hypothetical protein
MVFFSSILQENLYSSLRDCRDLQTGNCRSNESLRKVHHLHRQDSRRISCLAGFLAQQGYQSLREPRSATSTWNRLGSPGDRNSQSERWPSAHLRHLFQSPFSLPETNSSKSCSRCARIHWRRIGRLRCSKSARRPATAVSCFLFPQGRAPGLSWQRRSAKGRTESLPTREPTRRRRKRPSARRLA